MDKRLTTFMFAAMTLLLVNMLLQSWLFPPQKVARRDKPAAGDHADPAKPPGLPGDDKADGAAPGEKPDGDKPPAKAADEAAPAAPVDGNRDGNSNGGKAEAVATDEPPPAPQWLTLGSANAADPYRMLVTLTNIGAAVERAELNSDRYHDLEDRSGYLGYLATADAPNGAGALVRAVGAGTPAAAAGIKPNDVIEALDGRRLDGAAKLEAALKATVPGQKVEITIAGGQQVSATLGRRPLQIVRPEWETQPLDFETGQHDPLSMLFTFQQLGDRRLKDDANDSAEIKGLELRTTAWEVVNADQTQAEFRKRLPGQGIEVIKRYRLAKVAANLGPDQPAYHLEFEIEVHNIARDELQLAYRLDGPTGVVLEGRWYGSKISRAWFASAGLRDVLGKFKGQGSPGEITTNTIAANKAEPWPTAPVQYLSVDAQYFTTALIPDESLADEFLETRPLRVGAADKDTANHKLTDVSFRMTTRTLGLKPDERLRHAFTLFLGPRQPQLLANYGPPNARLGALIYYGWFDWVAEPMLVLLHFFYSLVRNYGVAIVMLTVLVRAAMFPLSRKQALSAQKMQELQPEMKALQEKYKKQPDQLMRAQAELRKKHNFNPFGGCLMAFIQLPIFMGLYRSLAVDVELRQAPLISDAIRWCSNLAAPDMLYDWSSWMPKAVCDGNGWLGLGPYLNVFPLVTIALFLWQQKMFMPPPTDEQTAMQQKVMQYMMIFMGIMFFKVPSGLCLYFITSSSWGLVERTLLNPPKPPQGAPSAAPASPPSGAYEGAGRNGDVKNRKSKQRGRR